MSTAQSAYNANDWQHYWENWLQTQQEFLRKQMQSPQSLQSHWDGFFREWKTNLGGTVPGAGAYQQMLSQASQQFLQMVQQFSQGASEHKSVQDIANEWVGNLQSFFTGLQQKNARPFDGLDSWRSFTESLMKSAPAWAGNMFPPGLAQPWGVPGWNAAWQTPGWNAAAWNPQGFGPGNWQQAQQFMNPENWQAPEWLQQQNWPQWDPGVQGFETFDPFGFCASLPGLGYTREKQEDLGQLYKHWVDFEAMARKYNASMAKVGAEAVQKFQSYLADPPEGAEPLNSLKQIYGKWVDICEDVYAGHALSDDYTAVYGEVVNALMTYKKKLHEIVDDMVEQMNLPTREEVDSLHKRVHELRRENLKMRKELAEIRGKLGIKKPAPAKAAAAKPAPAKKAKAAKKPAAKKSAKKGK
ncbi:MAG: hypothetical protein GC185_06510 [Alphaproteobacteria bacterium]|nr:hypothetical protein [Alphaproteobacteria bacterium]